MLNCLMDVWEDGDNYCFIQFCKEDGFRLEPGEERQYLQMKGFHVGLQKGLHWWIFDNRDKAKEVLKELRKVVSNDI